MVDMAKRTVRPSVRNRKMSGKTLCSGWTPLKKRKKRLLAR
jgi:hypothetical protein